MRMNKYHVAFVAALMASTAAFANEAREEFLEFEAMEYIPFVSSDLGGAPREANGPVGGSVTASFQGISQYDVAAYARNFVPPDTMGAVGTTQYTEFVNGGFAVYSKAGAVISAKSDLAFWTAAGQTGANGDSRVLFNKAAGRWIALAFGNSVSDIQIAVSDTANAAGTWKSTKFTGFAGGTADYPTLAMDNNAVYIGTNNFGNPPVGGTTFKGTTLNIIPLSSLFNAGAPTTAGLATLNTPYNGLTGGADGGFAIQGVNSDANTTQGHVQAVSLFYADTIRYNINNVGTPGQTVVGATYLGTDGYDGNGPGRQPNAVPDTGSTANFPNNNRVIDTLDDRFGSSVVEQNGKIYSVHTVTPTGEDFTVVRYMVVDAATNAILDEGDVGDATHDYYQGSLWVNKYGQVVIGYNRSGRDVATGNITFAAEVFRTRPDGTLFQLGAEHVLKVSLVDDYHNGTVFGQIATGRQRWGDYSSVTLDPTDDRTFWLIGEYAREYNNAAGGHVGGTGGSRWSTWISAINVGTTVPEPTSWAMLIAGFGLVGAATRRQRKPATVAA